MKCVLTSHNEVLVKSVFDELKSRGVRCMLKHEEFFRLRLALPRDEVDPEIWVLDDADAPVAHEVIQATRTALETPVQASPWTCPECGEHLEGQFTSCWHCGAERH